MSTVQFAAIIESGDHPGYSVFFPDLPGCASAGETVQAAASNAEIALNLHLAGMIEDGEAIPSPTPLDHLPVDPDVREVARILVRGEIPEKAMRVNITLHAQVLAVLDALSTTRNLDRSSMIAALVCEAGARQSIDIGETWPELMSTYKRLLDTNAAEAAVYWRKTIEPAIQIGRNAARGAPALAGFEDAHARFKPSRPKRRR